MWSRKGVERNWIRLAKHGVSEDLHVKSATYIVNTKKLKCLDLDLPRDADKKIRTKWGNQVVQSLPQTPRKAFLYIEKRRMEITENKENEKITVSEKQQLSKYFLT